MKNNAFKKFVMFVSILLLSSFTLAACDFETILQDFFSQLFPVIVDTTDPETNDEENNTEDPIQYFSSNLQNPSDDYVTNVALSGTVLSWQDVEESVNYVAYYSTSQSPELVQVDTQNQLDISSIVSTYDEIYAFRIGVKLLDESYVFTNITYYNPDNYVPYTSSSNIFYFNEQLSDYYIESADEFYLLAHYTYIYKVASYNVKLSTTYYNQLVSVEPFGMAIDNLLDYAYNESFMETIALSYGDTGANTTAHTFTVNLDFRGAEEPTLTLEKTVTQDVSDLPYYLTVNYTARDQEYNDFATDKKIILAPVETGEELYWAIESGATPVFSSDTSSGYLIYNLAKNILNEIISDEMTDYEKVRSIFDYVAYNSVYDYQIVSPLASTYMGTNPYTAYTSFYLEGVLEDGMAVCDGFSKTFTLLTNMEGIRSVRIVGTANGGGHAWNKVLLDNKWYVVDITWTELETEHYFTGASTEYLTHKYFLVSDAEIDSTHTPDPSQASKDYPANDVYDFFGSQTFNYDSTNYTFEIATVSQAEALINYMWEKFLAGGAVDSVSIEVAMTTTIINNWGTIVRSVKDEYNATHEDTFDNDTLRLSDGSIVIF